MPLLDVDDLKATLRIEHTADDALLERLLASALGVVEAELDRPLEVEEQTHVLERPAGPCPGLARDGARLPRTLRIPITPVAPDPAPVVVDGDGTTVDASTYRLNPRTGELLPVAGAAFTRWPYTVTAHVGLGTRADYSRVVAPALVQAVVDTVADWYQRRSPSAAAEGAGGGVYTQYAQAQLGLPQRVRDTLAPFRRVTP